MNNIDDVLAQMAHDNLTIDQKSKERQDKYQSAITSYGQSIAHE